uniref:Cytochrome c oxidase protein subunit VIa n=2 Tax=Thielaviopsis musarum TaxID=1580842 RepID=A0A2R4ZQ01_9PEZI|nr:TPA_exp: cytochrome c oxidase protein subunit VIa [Thielaviopsis musarum]
MFAQITRVAGKRFASTAASKAPNSFIAEREAVKHHADETASRRRVCRRVVNAARRSAPPQIRKAAFGTCRASIPPMPPSAPTPAIALECSLPTVAVAVRLPPCLNRPDYFRDIRSSGSGFGPLRRPRRHFGACIPFIGLSAANAYRLWNDHWEHWSHLPPLEERTEYPFQNIRSKNFPWGNGDESLFWNPSVNYHNKNKVK